MTSNAADVMTARSDRVSRSLSINNKDEQKKINIA